MSRSSLFAVLSLLPLASLSAELSACALPALEPAPGGEPLSLTGVEPDATALSGVAVDPRTGDLVLAAPGTGLVELGSDGRHLRTMRVGDWGLDFGSFNDVAVLDLERYVLATNGDTLLYDAAQATLESYFCLVPPMPSVVLENHAVAVVPELGRIFAAPAYYDVSTDEPSLQEAYHAQYAIADGSFVATADVLDSGVLAQGLAYDSSADRLYAVEGSTLHVFDAAGSALGAVALQGIEEGSGLALDDDKGALYVSDGADLEVRTFPLDALRAELGL